MTRCPRVRLGQHSDPTAQDLSVMRGLSELPASPGQDLGLLEAPQPPPWSRLAEPPPPLHQPLPSPSGSPLGWPTRFPPSTCPSEPPGLAPPAHPHSQAPAMPFVLRPLSSVQFPQLSTWKSQGHSAPAGHKHRGKQQASGDPGSVRGQTCHLRPPHLGSAASGTGPEGPPMSVMSRNPGGLSVQGEWEVLGLQLLVIQQRRP